MTGWLGRQDSNLGMAESKPAPCAEPSMRIPTFRASFAVRRFNGLRACENSFSARRSASLRHGLKLASRAQGRRLAPGGISHVESLGVRLGLRVKQR